nr:hypothetical protein PCIJMNHK_00127 [Klebsiella variicola]
MNRTNIFFGESHSDWLPVRGGESGDFVFRRGDGHAFAKIAPASRRGELAGERDRLIWLKGRGVACPEVINWQEEQEGACLVITAIPGVPAADLSGADLLKAWPSMGQQLGAVHSLSVDQGVLGIFRPKTTKCSGGPAVCGLQRGITFFEIPIWALFE